MRKLKNRIFAASLSVLLILGVLPAGQIPAGVAQAAAADGSVTIEGLETGDLVEIYRVCIYSESEFSWASAVATWIKDTDAGQEYSELTPTTLASMNATSARTFMETMLMGLKNDSKGVANLTGESYTVKEDSTNKVTLNPGYYVILPKGTDRIYGLKWFILNPGTEITVTYTATDYSVPEITTTLTNSEDRGTAKDGVLETEETVSEGESSEVVDNRTTYPLTYIFDTVTVTSDIKMPTYTSMYTAGKRILNISLIVPYGLDYTEDSLTIQSKSSSSGTFDTLDTASYSKQEFDKAYIYTSQTGEMLFFGQSDYFYSMDGTALAGPNATAEAAVNAYNTIHETEYYVVADTSTASTETSESVSDGSTTETEETTPIEEETEDTSMLLDKSKKQTVIILSLDTSEEASIAEVQTTLTATKNVKSSDTGWYDVLTGLSYSVSPLDSNLRALALKAARIGSYGLKITTCKGEHNSYKESSEYILSNAERTTEDKFSLYKKTNTYEGDLREGLGAVSDTSSETDTATSDTTVSEGNTEESTTEADIQLLYDEDTDTTIEYTEIAQLEVNSKGEVSIGGLSPDQYLLVQTTSPTGYTLSQTSVVIDTTDWTSDAAMEGNCVFDLIWLNYETYYMPATGSTGRADYKVFAVLILFGVGLLIASGYRKQKKS